MGINRGCVSASVREYISQSHRPGIRTIPINVNQSEQSFKEASPLIFFPISKELHRLASSNIYANGAVLFIAENIILKPR